MTEKTARCLGCEKSLGIDEESLPVELKGEGPFCGACAAQIISMRQASRAVLEQRAPRRYGS